MPSFRHLFRNLARTPFLSAVIVLSLGVGIGANTVIYSWLKSALFAPLPGAEAPRLMSLEVKDDTGNWVTTSWTEYQDLRELVPSLAGIAAQRPRSFSLGAGERDARVYGEFVSGNFFEVLGVRAQLGRFFKADEAARPGGAPVVVLSDAFWRRQFHRADDVVGRTLRLNGRTLTIVGVAAPDFRGGYNALTFDLFLPATLMPLLQPASDELTARKARTYTMLAQLRPGVSLAQVQAELDAAAKKLLDAYPETNRGLAYGMLPLWRSPRGGQILVASLATLQVFAALILTVVCVNTASLLLARASTRRREIGIRLAVGGAPARILVQLLGESVLLALLGGAAGVLFSLWGVEIIGHLPLPSVDAAPIFFTPEIDATSVAFAALVSLGCGVLFGLAPAAQLVRADVLHALRGGAGAVTGRHWLRDGLVALEVATALVVLVLAALYLQSFRNSLRADTGYDTTHVMLATVDLSGRGYDQTRSHAFVEETLRRLRETPGVISAAAANNVPLATRGLATGVFAISGRPFDPNRRALYFDVTPGYFATMGVAFVDGGDIAPLSRQDLPLDAVINEEMAQRYWPGESPVGRKFIINDTWFVIAGVVRTTKYETVGEAPKPMTWLSLRRQPAGSPTLHVRTSGDPRAALGSLRQIVRALDPELALVQPRTLAANVDSNLVLQRLPARMLSLLAPLALALAAVGLYAVIAYSLAQRVQEIGVRLALGASPRRVVQLMTWQGLRVVLVGTAAGWVVALALGYVLQPRLVGVAFGDPLIYGGVPLLLIAVAVLACWLPARRAASVDPMIALRSE